MGSKYIHALIVDEPKSKQLFFAKKIKALKVLCIEAQNS